MAVAKKKSTGSRASSVRRKTVARKSAHKTRVIGVTSDGVKILRPTARPTHFTSEQIREAIREVLATRAKR